MINVVRAESERFWARRMTRFFPAVLAVLMLGGIVIAYVVISGDDGNSPDFVDDIAGGVQGTGLLEPVANLLPIMAFVIGASFIGADLRTGMLEQILTWEPRRSRLLAARLIAGSIGVAILAMALAALLVALLYALAAATGTADGTTGELWGNVAVAIVRTGVASGLFCAFGLGTTLLINNSIGSIVGFVIYWFIVENFLITAFLPAVAVYLPIANAASFASGSAVQQISGSVFSEFDVSDHHGYLLAGVILAAWTLAAVIAAGVAFSRRDIA
ncbi:MAG: hypothetical protein ACFCVK_03730 [Acidimicrobiales bacterium]